MAIESAAESPVSLLPKHRSLIVLMAITLFSALFIACGEFKAEITSDTASGAAPLAVSFTNGGSDAESQTWDFGDGSEIHNSGVEKSASHIFTKAGTFTVTINSTKGDKTATSTMTVTVSPGPLASVNLDEWQGGIVAGSSVPIGAVAVDEFGNVITDASLAYQAPSDAGTVDASGNFSASTTSGEFPGGLVVTASHAGQTVDAAADLNVLTAQMDRLEVEPADLEVTPTESVQIVIRPIDIYGNEITDADVEVTADSSVGTVTGQGAFTAARAVASATEGISVTVTVGSEERSATIPVTVIPGALDSVSITPSDLETGVTGSGSFSAVAFDAFGNEVPGVEITWSASDEAGEVDGSGNFTAGTLAGTFDSAITATATREGESTDGSIDVTLLAGEFSQVVAELTQVVAGETAQLTATAADEYGNPIDGASLEWSVETSAVGSVDDSGVLTAGGRARVYSESVSVSATLNGVTFDALADVEITPSTLSQVLIAPGDVTLGMSIEQQYVAAAGDRFGNRIEGVTFAWSASAAAGTIDGNGVFTSGNTPGTYAGAVTVVATHQGEQVTHSAKVVVDPDRIVFYSDRNNEDGQFFLMNVDGTGQSGLPFGEFAFGQPDWSPDGRRLVYDVFTFSGGVITTDESGTYQWLLVSNSFSFAYTSPKWSPDGKQVVMTEWDINADTVDLVLIDIDGGNFTYLTDTPSLIELTPSWSPDGTHILYAESQNGAPSDIYRINVQTKQKQRLTNHPADDVEPVYSPDGTKILFATGRDGNSEVYVMNADGSGQTNLTQSVQGDGGALWSADGSQILFVSFRDGDGEIYVMNADGADVTKLTNNSDLDTVPVWAPRKTGVTVNADTMVLPNLEPSTDRTVQSLTAELRASVVRIETDLATGSGFIISEDGLILTNNHVVSDASDITVMLDDGTEYDATVVGRDLTHDLAVLRIDATGLQALTFGTMTQDGLGSDVVVLGYPLGSTDLNVTRGVVSAVKADTGRASGWVQTDAAVNPGNSGGPMVNMQGEVVGIVSAGLFGTTVENVGLAVDSATILVYLERLIAGETVVLN